MLKEDVYMDDICHSEDTVRETRKIAEDFDKILKNSGFSVKNWISNEPLTPVNEDSSEEETKVLKKKIACWEQHGIVRLIPSL